MTKIAQLTMVVGMLTAGTVPALAQMDRYDPRYDRLSYDRPQHDTWQYEQPDVRLPAGQYEATRAGPIERRQGVVTFITGGVGKDEAAAFRTSMSRYALGLEFARTGTPRGTFLAGIHVSVIDNRGRTVLDTVSDGPFLLADLLTGTYIVRAASNGQVKTQTVTILPDLHQHVKFVW